MGGFFSFFAGAASLEAGLGGATVTATMAAGPLIILTLIVSVTAVEIVRARQKNDGGAAA